MGRFRHLFLRGLRVCNSRPLRNLRGLVGPRVGPWRRRSLSSMTDPSPLYAGGVIAEVTRLSSLCASEAAAALAEGSCSAVQLLEACQARAEAMRWTNALLTELPVRAREAAQASDDRRRENKSLGPLDGIPVVVKDNFCVEGSATTAGSRFLSNFIAPYTATVVSRLEAGGAVVLGKSNMDEFGMGSANTNSAFGDCLNPWAPQAPLGGTANPKRLATCKLDGLNPRPGPGAAEARVAGGSSGGSAAAVASGMGILGLGSDTGGSVRLPASYCGVVGLKPSYGRLSRHGLVAFCSSLDCPGLFTRSVADSALMLAAMQGKDDMDSTSLPGCPELDQLRKAGPDLQERLAAAGGVEVHKLHSRQPLEGFRVGIDLEDNVGAEAKDALKRVIHAMQEGGAEVVTLPTMQHTKAALGAYYVLAPAEASSNLARYDGLRFGLNSGEALSDPARAEMLGAHRAAVTANRTAGFGPEVQRRILMGTFALSSEHVEGYFLRAQRVRRLVAQDFEKAFRSVDLIAGPVVPGAAPLLQRIHQLGSAEMYASDAMTVPASLAGLPALSLPASLTNDGLPIGVQLIAPRLRDAKLLGLASVVELLLKQVT